MLENGFILLTDNQFDYQQLIADLHTDWQISADNIDNSEDSFVFYIGECMCALALMPAPIPNGEAESRAQGNYYCSDAVAIAQAHQAHLMVTVMQQFDTPAGEGAIALMSIYSKVVASALKQSHATGVYTSGTVFSADFYRAVCQQYLTANNIPIMVWVFIGLGQTEGGSQAYTVGMEKFHKHEMEVLNSPIELQTLHGSLLSMCSYIITANLTLKDGETIGFSADEKWQISQSPSVYAPSEQSLKIVIH